MPKKCTVSGEGDHRATQLRTEPITKPCEKQQTRSQQDFPHFFLCISLTHQKVPLWNHVGPISTTDDRRPTEHSGKGPCPMSQMTSMHFTLQHFGEGLLSKGPTEEQPLSDRTLLQGHVPHLSELLSCHSKHTDLSSQSSCQDMAKTHT